MKISKGDWIAIVVFIVILQMLSFWCIDISVSALISDGKVVSAFMSMSPVVTYHLGLYLSLGNFAFLILITVHHVLHEKKIKTEKTVKKKKEDKKEEPEKEVSK